MFNCRCPCLNYNIKMTKEKYIKNLERIETYYEFGTIFLFAFGCAFFSIAFFSASIASFVFMGVFAFNKVRIMKKIEKVRK